MPILTVRWARFLFAALAVCLLTGGVRAVEPAAAPHDYWYVLELQGQRAGWVHISRADEDDRITSSAKMKLAIRRGAMSMSIGFETEFVETAGGEPISMRTKQELGKLPIESRYTFEKDQLLSETRQGNGEWVRTTTPLPFDDKGEWMCPAEATRHIEQRIAAGDKEFSIRVLDPMNGTSPIGAGMTLLGEENVEVLGKTVPAMKWKVTTDLLPGMAVTDYTDLTGVSVRSTMNIGGLSVTTLLADKQLALADAEPPELLISTMVKPNKPISDPRGLQRATYVIKRAKGGELPLLPSGGQQRVERIDGSSCRVTVDVSNPLPAEAGDAKDERYIKPSVMVASDDEKVKAMTTEALKSLPADATALRKAETLREFVHDYIEEKNLGVGFATASEVARTATGDCTEHGVLLAAMLRAAGVPSRVVAGLLYVDHFEGATDIFGYHMWTQALVEIDGKTAWVDVDAVLPPNGSMGRSDATHIALAFAALDKPEVQNSLVELAPLMGGLEIIVEKAE